MPRRRGTVPATVSLFLLAANLPLPAADTFTIATYNLENYLNAPAGNRPPKSEASREKIRESLLTLKPDVLALQEVGGIDALLELRSALKSAGLDYPHWEFVAGFDTNIHVSVLSRFPFTARHPRTNEGFLLNGRRFRISRGFAEVEIQAGANYKFTLLAAHLKSRREVPAADEADLREQEAILLRGIIDAHLKADPDINLVVLGDFNDVKDSKPIRTLLGRGRTALIDTRPAEQNGDDRSSPIPRMQPRDVTWTYYYGKEDTYSRIDYILLSRGMAREWNSNAAFVLSLPNWGLASDHRPIIGLFTARDK
jgi:endonuclease/exonuclease/phosphatase family metal-dependent hydrolase